MPDSLSIASHGIAKAFTAGQITQQVIKDCSLNIYAGELTLVVDRQVREKVPCYRLCQVY